MANKNKKTNELVSDDADTTAEVEQITSPHLERDVGANTESEVDAETCSFETSDRKPDRAITEFESELQKQSETINRLEYDIEQLQSRRQGLETELRAREELTTRLNGEIAEFQALLERKDKLLGQRGDTIKSLRTEVRERDDELQGAIARHEQLLADVEQERETLDEILRIDDTGQYQRRLAEQAGRLASHEALIRDLTEKFTRAEGYGDFLRRRLQESANATDAAVRARDELQHAHDLQEAEISAMRAEIDALENENLALSKDLAGIHEAHAEELRKVRFELGEAQETAAQHEQINEQLAADLVQTHGFTVELENKLDRTDKENRARIEELEKENRLLRSRNQEQEEQLESKSEAIHALLAEIGKGSKQAERDDNIDVVIKDLEDDSSEHLPDPPQAPEKDRVTRVLIGSIEGQELQFPLFKDRLTIGRTEHNDIQLKAPYISRRHALVVTEGDTTRVVDWGSKNGVFVNSRRVSERFLNNGDVVAIGIAKFRYEERSKR